MKAIRALIKLHVIACSTLGNPNPLVFSLQKIVISRKPKPGKTLTESKRSAKPLTTMPFKITEAYSNRGMLLATGTLAFFATRTLPVSILSGRSAWATSIISRALWAGVILGIDFVEAWVKFRSDLVSQDDTGYGRVVAFSIGRLIFATNNRLEMGLAGLACVAHLRSASGSSLPLYVYAPTAILTLQSAWLQPELDAHGRNIIRGYLKDREEAIKANKPVALKPVRTKKSAIEHAIVGTLVLAKTALLLFGCYKDIMFAIP